MPPAWGDAAQLPVWRQRCHHFSTVDLLMAKVSATSACDDAPASRVAMTRSRRSWE
jgi:hypothetical protein